MSRNYNLLVARDIKGCTVCGGLIWELDKFGYVWGKPACLSCWTKKGPNKK